MMKSCLALLLILLAAQAGAQTGPDAYWVQFTDKDATPYSVGEPQEFLSPRAVQRRAAQGIAVDALDLPVDPAYIGAVLATGNVQLINRSKWFNAITVRTTDEQALAAIAQLPFVSAVRGTRRLTGVAPDADKFTLLAEQAIVARGGGQEDYGAGLTQISMHNGHLLHAMEAKGQGMLIGVLDSGFDQTDALAAFEDLRAREGIVLTRDMVNHDGDVYADHWHGRSVLSCMAGVLPGEFQGTAPLADYALVRTEEVAYELVIEEDNWVAGAELLDSLGADVLNTSLGYTAFDDSLQDHVYADMDGATTRISIAAGIAAQKGMIPVQSSGNSGTSEWHFIGAPADAFDILAVGAVGAEGQHAPFSSWGPSADGRVKPDVMAMGWGAMGLRVQGDSIAPLNGTSFSSPILAGLVACLWQLHPDQTAHEVMDAVRRSAHLWTMPNDSMGYGIPDFMVAHALLTAGATEAEEGSGSLSAYPNPFEDRLLLAAPGMPDGTALLKVYDAAGRVALQRNVPVSAGTARVEGLENLPSGLWLFQLRGADRMRAVRVAKP